jgi:hypothetical protein
VIATLGESVRERYRIVIDDAPGGAKYIALQIGKVRELRRKTGDAYYFNWLLRVPEDYQLPFMVSHESVASLRLHGDLPAGELVSNLRRAFSAIVTGNVKDHGIRMIREHGPFEIRGDAEIVDRLGRLLEKFAEQGRMKIASDSYEPCYRVVAP